MPLFLVLRQTLNNWSFTLQVTHGFEVHTCWVLSIIARASAISFWLTPQRFATFVWHLWWTFMSQAERKNRGVRTTESCWAIKDLTSGWGGRCCCWPVAKTSIKSSKPRLHSIIYVWLDCTHVAFWLVSRDGIFIVTTGHFYIHQPWQIQTSKTLQCTSAQR